MDGIVFSKETLLTSPQTVVIIVTAHGTIDTAVRA